MHEIETGRTHRTHPFQDPKFRGSWSGFERDCFFFNSPGPVFADAGYAFGLDLDDDGRAVAPVDIDGDGDLDLAIFSLQGLRLFENRAASGRFLRVRLRATRGDAQALGAVVTVHAGGRMLRDYVKATTGLSTQVPLDLHFGLGDAARADRVEVRWPDGTREEFGGVAAGRVATIVQGSGRIETAALPRWPAAESPRGGASPAILADRVGGGLRTVVRYADAPLDGVAARVVSVRGDGPEAGAVVRFFGGEAPPAATLVFEENGRLHRVFRRPASRGEVEAVLEAMGKGDFTVDHVHAALFRLERGEYDAADREIDAALARTPEDASALFARGLLRGLQKRDAEAAEAFERTLAVDPTRGRAAHNLGVALYKCRRLPDAERALAEAVRLEPGYAESHHVLGQVLAESGRLAEAEQRIREAVRLNPNGAHALWDLGRVLGALGRPDEGRAAIDRAVQINPELADVRRRMK